jgi:antitoxin component of MazEF toxin-antitoxin module
MTKLQRTEQGMVVVLPDELVATLGLSTDTEVTVALNPAHNQIVIAPAVLPLAVADIDQDFVRQVADFIEQYRPALETLAR